MNILPLLLLSMTVFMAGPKAAFETKKHDFGSCKERSKVSFAFKFENKGDQPLVITDTKTSCECTKIHFDPAPILPGQKGEVHVSYDATKVGSFYRKATIYTNAGKTDLIIKGEIVKGKGKVNPITGE